MSKLIYILFLWIFSSVSCDSSADEQFYLQLFRVINRFVNVSSLPGDTNNASNTCTVNLVTQLNESWNGTNSFYNSYKFGSTFDLLTLELDAYVSKDLQCKLDGVQMKQRRRYCSYRQIQKPDLSDGFLLGFCIPDKHCNDLDARILGEQFLLDAKNDSNGAIDRYELICSNDHYDSYGAGFYVTIVIILILIALSLAATTAELTINCRNEVKRQKTSAHVLRFVKIFSVQSNFKKLTHRNKETSVGSLHFFKFLAMSFIVLCRMYALTRIFASNFDDQYYPDKSWIFLHVFYNGSYLIGTFFVIGGLLHSYGSLLQFAGHDPDKGQTPKFSPASWLMAIFYKYLRILPLYLCCLLLIAFVWPYWLERPLWHTVDQTRQCPSELWRHLLFLNNFKSVQMCAPWTWYFAAEFQLFVIFTPVVAALIYRPKIAYLICILLTVAACVAKIVLMLQYDFPPALMFMFELPRYNSNLAHFSTALYTTPWFWAPCYAAGCLSGHVIHRLNRKNRRYILQWYLQIAFWSLSVFALLWIPFGLFWHRNSGFKSGVYDSLYVSLGAVAWSLALAWVFVHSKIFLSSYHVTKFYGLQLWLILSHLTYGSYLVHPVVAFWLMYKFALEKDGRPKSHVPYTDIFGMLLCTILISYMISFFLYLIVEGPSANVKNLLLRKLISRGNKKKPAGEKKSELITQLISVDMGKSPSDEIHLDEVPDPGHKDSCLPGGPEDPNMAFASGGPEDPNTSFAAGPVEAVESEDQPMEEIPDVEVKPEDLNTFESENEDDIKIIKETEKDKAKELKRQEPSGASK